MQINKTTIKVIKNMFFLINLFINCINFHKYSLKFLNGCFKNLSYRKKNVINLNTETYL